MMASMNVQNEKTKTGQYVCKCNNQLHIILAKTLHKLICVTVCLTF